MRRFMQWTGVLLALLLVAAGFEAHTSRTIPAADAATTTGKFASGRNLNAAKQQHGEPRRVSPRARLTALRSRWPVHGPVNSDFGARRSFWRMHSHRGIDIGARPGTTVRAPLGGSVAFAGWRAAYGKTIIIDHGGEYHTLYGHLSKVGVRRGQRIEPGASIGRTGATGNASGPHLNYEVLVHGRPVNPRDPVPNVAAPGGADREQRGKRARSISPGGLKA